MTSLHALPLRTRASQIALILTRHGLGYLVDILGLEQFVPFRKGWFKHSHRDHPYSRPEHMRMALEELGPTFIKLGQMVSTRTDLIPPAYQAELVKLQDEAPVIPTEQIEQVLRDELGAGPDELFATFDRTPLAAASIGQVHAATLSDGTEVVVKIRRPGVIEKIEADLELLHHLAVSANQHWELARQYDVVALVQEFSQALRAELDYIREGHNAERFATNFASNATVHIPRVYWNHTTVRVLTLERIRGLKISDVVAIEAAGLERPLIARRTASLLLKMVFEDGFFHADPHPGNFFVEQGGRIGVIDFGLVGTVDAATQEQLVNVLLALTKQDTQRLVDALLALGVTHQVKDRQGLEHALSQLLSRYYGRALGELKVGPLLEETFTIMRTYRLQLPSQLALLLKTVVMSEGMGMQLDPNFHLAELLAPYAQRMILRQFSPFFWTKQVGEASLDMAWLGVELPQHLRRLLPMLERGEMQMSIRPIDVEPLLHRLELICNRIVLGILTAAFIIGLAILLLVYHPASWQQWAGPAFMIGFFSALVLGVVIAWGILRSRRL
jgi:Predicted unusual protein kinase